MEKFRAENAGKEATGRRRRQEFVLCQDDNVANRGLGDFIVTVTQDDIEGTWMPLPCLPENVTNRSLVAPEDRIGTGRVNVDWYSPSISGLSKCFRGDGKRTVGMKRETDSTQCGER